MKPNETRTALLAWCRAVGEPLPVVRKGSPEWWDWRAWRKSHGLGVAFMDTAPTFTVPALNPPTDDQLLTAAHPNTRGYRARKDIDG